MFQSSSTASGNCARQMLERLLAVLGLGDLEVEAFQDAPRDLADDAEIVDDQAGLHDTSTF